MKRLFFLCLLSSLILSACVDDESSKKLAEQALLMETLTETLELVNDDLEEIKGTVVSLEETIIILENDLVKNQLEYEELKKYVNTLEENKNKTIEALEEENSQLSADIRFINNIYFGDRLFDPKTIDVGDQYADMTFVEHEEYSTVYKFTGEKILSGSFERYEDNDYWGKAVLFTLADEDESLLPRAKGDSRYIWFTFSNYEEAHDMFKPYGLEGNIKIKIDAYSIDILEGCVVNQAHLVEILD